MLFPQIEELAVSRAIFGNINSGQLDTVNMVLVKYASPLPQAKEREFVRFLEARLQHKTLRLINVGNQVTFSKKTAQDKKK